MDRLKDILNKARNRYPSLSKRWDEALAVSRWETAVGPQIAKHARAVRVQEGVLMVEVDHPIWRSELHHRKAQILANLNRAIEGAKPGEKPIADLLFYSPRPY